MNNIAKLLIGFLFFLLVLWFVQGAFATVRAPYKVICHHNPSQSVTLTYQNQQSYNGHLGTPHNDEVYDTDGACVDPTNTPVPTDEPEVTEMPDYCEEEGYQPYGPCEAEITPEVTPEVTPVVTQAPVVHQPRMADATAPMCSDITPSRVNDIWLEADETGNNTLVLRWGTSEAQNVHIVYGFAPHDMRYSLLNTEDDGYEAIGGLDNSRHYWFAIQAVRGCAVSEPSDWIDPLP